MEEGIEENTRQLDDIEEEQANSNLFQKAIKFRESVTLVEKRGKLKLQLQDLEQTYPLESGRVMRGTELYNTCQEGYHCCQEVERSDGYEGAISLDWNVYL